MTRPTVQIDRPNQLNELRARLDHTLPKLIAAEGVIGATLNGGLSRGYGDHLSEIDVTLYLTPETYRTWNAGGAPFGTGIQMIDDALYDLKLMNIEDERAATWSMDALWDASYAQILYDPLGEVAALLKTKLASPPQPLDAGGVMFRAWWFFRLAGDIWIHRGDPLQGHALLNAAVDSLIQALFFANGEYVAHEKWRVHFSRSLAWHPDRWEERLTEVLCAITPTLEGLRQRQQQIAALWDEIDQHIIASAAPDYPLNVMHKFFYDLLKLLIERGSVPISEWETHAGLDLLNNAPFNACTRIEGDRVVLDRERLAAVSAADLYSWHYAVVAALRGN